MKGIMNFFFRLDIPRIFCMVLVIPCILVTIFTPLGVKLAFIFIPLSILLILGCVLRPHLPTEDEVLRSVRELPKGYVERLKRDFPKMNEHNTLILEAASDERAFLARKMGTRLIYPVCRTLVFYRGEKGVQIFMRDDPLFPGGSPAERRFFADSAAEGSGEADPNRPPAATVSVGKYDEARGRARLGIHTDKETFTAYASEFFKLKELNERFAELIRNSEK